MSEAPAFTDTYYDPWHHRRKGHTSLPGAGELAAMVRTGETLDSLAEAFERSPSTIVRILNDGGYSTRTGYPMDGEVEDDDLGPVFIRDDQPWMADGLCAQTDPESFFPIKGGSVREAKAVCARCPVSAECLDYALAIDARFGIWGGLSERERRTVKAALAEEPIDDDNRQEHTP